MQFRDDGGTPAWRARHMTITNRRGPSFVQWLILIVFFAYAVPLVLIFGGPAVGALAKFIADSLLRN